MKIIKCHHMYIVVSSELATLFQSHSEDECKAWLADAGAQLHVTPEMKCVSKKVYKGR